MSAELVDALGDLHHVLLLFFGVLPEFFFRPVARDPGRGDRVHGVAQHAHDLGRERPLQELDGLFTSMQ